MNTLRNMQSVIGYAIMARNWARTYSCLQVADAMIQRLRLDRFDYDALDEVDKRKYDDLRLLLDSLAKPSQ